MKLAAIVTALAAALSLTVSPAQPATAEPAQPAAETKATRLGIIGNYSDGDMSRMRTAGKAADALIELEWGRAEPTRGHFDEAYLAQISARITALKSLGYTISLNTGIQNAPAWLLALPGARYVDQFGATYTGSDEPNLIFGTRYRYLAVRYLTKVFARLGTGFSIVRAGGGHWGELTYPFQLDPSTGRLRNLYFAFDAGAAATDPVPSWRPGRSSPHGESAKFLTWYLNALTGYQNWQITALRKAGYGGLVAVLYPSWGMRAGDFDDAVATDLAGTSSAEINGEVQRGYDATGQIAALADKKVVVYGTWAENPGTITYLAGLAAAKGLPVMAETTHTCTPGELPATIRQARASHLVTLYLVRQEASDVVSDASLLTSPAA